MLFPFLLVAVGLRQTSFSLRLYFLSHSRGFFFCFSKRTTTMKEKEEPKVRRLKAGGQALEKSSWKNSPSHWPSFPLPLFSLPQELK